MTSDLSASNCTKARKGYLFKIKEKIMYRFDVLAYLKYVYRPSSGDAKRSHILE
jgi:hypothetical protein